MKNSANKNHETKKFDAMIPDIKDIKKNLDKIYAKLMI